MTMFDCICCLTAWHYTERCFYYFVHSIYINTDSLNTSDTHLSVTCDVQTFREPHQSDVVPADGTVEAFVRYDAAHRVSRVKQTA